MMLSPILRVVESICVVVPFTSKFPLTVKLDPVISITSKIDELKLFKLDVELWIALIVVIFELVYEFKLPVDISIESTRFFVLIVVVAIDALNKPIELETELLKLFVVVATDELNAPILVDMEELNVE